MTEAGIKVQSSFPKYIKENIIFDLWPSLQNCIDSDGLILWKDLLSNFDHLTANGASNLGYFKSKTSEYSIMLHPYFRRSFTRINNFSPSLLESLMLLYYHFDNNSLKIALDTDCVMLTKDWHGICEREYHYGAPFNNDIPSNKEGCVEYTAVQTERILTDSVATQFYWHNKDEYIQFELEEIRDPDRPNTEQRYDCRYIHSLFKKDTHHFSHLDGAIRQYDIDSIHKRRYTPLDKSGKKSNYKKIFRADGNIPFDLWKRIISSFSPYNNSIIEYFNA